MAYPFNNYGGYSPNSYVQAAITPNNNNLYQNYQNTAQMGNFGARNFIFATEEELKSQVISPNSQLFGLDQQNSILRVKTVDAIGNVDIKSYKLNIIDESKTKTTEVNASEYLTKKDIENLVTKDELNSFMQKCQDIEKLLKVGNKNAKESV